MVQFSLIALVCGTLAGFSIYGLAVGDFDTDDATHTIGVALTVLSTGLTLASILALVTLPLRKDNLPAVAVDVNGVWWVNRQRVTLTSWQDLVAVGTSYKVSTRSKAQAPGAFRQSYAFEAYLTDPAGVDGRLRHWAVNEDPPRQDLPSKRLRYVMPVAGARTELQRAVVQHAPQLWVGDHERESNPVPNR